LLALAALPYAFFCRRSVPHAQKAALALAVFCLIFLALAAVTPHHLNLRYVCAIFGPFYLLAGIGFQQVLQLARKYLKPYGNGIVAILAVCLLFSAVMDYRHFKTSFADTDMQDLSIRMVLTASESGCCNHDSVALNFGRTPARLLRESVSIHRCTETESRAQSLQA
jgi:hypothetical protein